MKIKLTLIFLVFFANPVLAFEEYISLRVGVFQNNPVLYHEGGVAKGLYVDTLNYIAGEEGWGIEYVTCGFAECLDMLRSGEIHLMPSIVDLPERRKDFIFSKKPMWSFYGTIFTHDPKITGLLDLKGLRIGGRKASVYSIELQKLLDSFNIEAEMVPYDEYSLVYDDLSDGKIDAAAVNNTFAYSRKDLTSIYQTPIVFSPFDAVWAISKDYPLPEILPIIDHYVIELQKQDGSLYYQFKDKWFQQRPNYWDARNIFMLIVLPIFVVVGGMVLYHYYTLILMNNKLRKSLTDIAEADKTKTRLEARLRQAQKMEAIGTLAGGIAHDFNNILTVILGYAELMQHEKSTCLKDCTLDCRAKCAESYSKLQVILEAGAKARDLVKRILTFSRQADPELKKLDAAVEIKKILEMIRSTLPTTIKITTDIDETVGNIYANETGIQQIIMNLCINAFHAMEESGGELSIGLYRTALSEDDLQFEEDIQSGEFIKISIRDTGYGIPTHVRDQIFDPYFTTKGMNKGTGMGLSIVHGIIKQYGGIINLHTETGVGTTFSIHLPISNGAIPHTVPIDVSELIGKEKLLLVDDELLIVDVNKMLLESFGYTVDVLTNPLEAVKIFQEDPFAYDLVITDQTMPTMTGFELATELLKMRDDLPVILCSGYSSVLSDEKIKSSGISEFALKPILKNDLAKLVRKALINGSGALRID